MHKAAISTIIPTYNRAHLLDRAISSVLRQLEAHDELIVVDDGSTDHTEIVVARFGDRIRYIRTPNNGAGAARNCGVKEARNPLIAFLDSDDEWMPGKIKIQRAFMQARQDILFCFSNFTFKATEELGGKEKHFNLVSWSKDTRSWDEILGPGQSVSSFIALLEGMDDFNYHVGDMYRLELAANYINVNTLMARREEAGDALHFAEDTKTYEDWECFGRLARAGKCAYLDCEMACQHSHGGPRLVDAGGFERSEARVSIIERVWGCDEVFLKEHGSIYQRVLTEERISKISGLILKGRTKEAREEITKLQDCPVVYRILATMPGWLAKPTAGLLRMVRRASKRIVSWMR